jgi:hypothetical protein
MCFSLSGMSGGQNHRRRQEYNAGKGNGTALARDIVEGPALHGWSSYDHAVFHPWGRNVSLRFLRRQCRNILLALSRRLVPHASFSLCIQLTWMFIYFRYKCLIAKPIKLHAVWNYSALSFVKYSPQSVDVSFVPCTDYTVFILRHS